MEFASEKKTKIVLDIINVNHSVPLKKFLICKHLYFSLKKGQIQRDKNKLVTQSCHALKLIKN